MKKLYLFIITLTISLGAHAQLVMFEDILDPGQESKPKKEAKSGKDSNEQQNAQRLDLEGWDGSVLTEDTTEMVDTLVKVAVVANLDYRYLYRYYENHINIAVPGIRVGGVFLLCKGANATRIEGKADTWRILADKSNTSSEVRMEVMADVDSSLTLMDTIIFHLLDLPSPNTYLTYNGQEIDGSRNREYTTLLSTTALASGLVTIMAEYEAGSLVHSDWTVHGFTVRTPDGKEKMFAGNVVNNKALLKQIKSTCKAGDYIVLKNIKAHNEYGGVVDVPAVYIELQ